MTPATAMRTDDTSPHQPIPERQLIVAVIERALRDAVSVASPMALHARRNPKDYWANERANEIRDTARAWLESDDDEDRPWSFLWCVAMVDLGPGDVEAMREILAGPRIEWDGRGALGRSRRKFG